MPSTTKLQKAATQAIDAALEAVAEAERRADDLGGKKVASDPKKAKKVRSALDDALDAAKGRVGEAAKAAAKATKAAKGELGERTDVGERAARHLAESEQRLAESEKATKDASARAVAAEQRLTAAEQRVSAAEERATDAEQRAAAAEQRASAAEKATKKADSRADEAARRAEKAEKKAAKAKAKDELGAAGAGEHGGDAALAPAADAAADELSPPLPQGDDEGDLSARTLVSLRTLAKERGLTNVSRLSKAALVERLGQG